MVGAVNRRSHSVSAIAEERIRILYKMAREVFGSDPALARRYVELAKQIGMRTRVRIPGELKYLTCKKCHNLLIPGVNCRVRVRADRGTRTVMTCLMCGSVKRYPAIEEKLRKRKSPPPSRRQ
ncbi:MAG: ribonuclease P protein component 4 [archaeon]